MYYLFVQIVTASLLVVSMRNQQNVVVVIAEVANLAYKTSDVAYETGRSFHRIATPFYYPMLVSKKSVRT